MEEFSLHIKQSYLLPKDEIPVQKLFLATYCAWPQRICITPVARENETNVVYHVKSVLDRIQDKFNTSNRFAVVRRHFHPCSKTYYIVKQLLSTPHINGIMIYLTECIWVTNYANHSKKPIQPDYIPDRHFLTTKNITLFYLSEHENFVQQLAHDLINDDTLSLVEPKIASLRLIGKHKDHCNGPGSFYLAGSTCIKKPHINDLGLSYGGQDFLKVHHKIVTWLNTDDARGLVLLHGAPGSGKTHYIRYLLHSIANAQNRYLIYIPGDMTNDLSTPTLIPLLVSHPKSLLIIEDAEGSLSRIRSTNQSVANLLNLSDGLLSDGIQVQILATFNCPLTSLDAALLRPGRLVAQYCFPSTLNVENARCLAESIGVLQSDQINEPLSLADIYDMRGEKIVEEQDEVTSSTCHKCCRFNQYDGGEEE